MTTEAKALAILLAIRDAVNETDGAVTLESDWGGNSLTVAIRGLGHSHVGDTDWTDDQLIDSLHAMFCEHRGLSFAPEASPLTRKELAERELAAERLPPMREGTRWRCPAGCDDTLVIFGETISCPTCEREFVFAEDPQRKLAL